MSLRQEKEKAKNLSARQILNPGIVPAIKSSRLAIESLATAKRAIFLKKEELSPRTEIKAKSLGARQILDPGIVPAIKSGRLAIESLATAKRAF